MENNTNKNTLAAGAKAPTAGKVAAIPVTGKMSVNDKGYLVTMLDNPFPDEPLGELSMQFKNPGKIDRFGSNEHRMGDRHSGAFQYCVTKAGKEVPFKGEVTYHCMTDKKGNSAEYVAIYLESPFPEMNINEGHPVRAFFRSGAVQGMFDLVAMSKLELTPQREFKKGQPRR